MSVNYRKLVIWLLKIIILVSMVACVSKPGPTQKTAALVTQTPPATSNPSKTQSSSLAALEVARQMIGTPYRYGGKDPRGFDCSGLVQYSFRKAGIKLPRTSSDIFRKSQLVAPGNRQPGDLVFFAISKGKVSHVGIYAEQDKFIHSPSSGKGVSYASLENPYWKSRLVGVGRLH